MTQGQATFLFHLEKTNGPAYKLSLNNVLIWSVKTLISAPAVICQRLLPAGKDMCQIGLYPQNGLNRLKRICAGGSDGLGDGSNDKDLSGGNL